MQHTTKYLVAFTALLILAVLIRPFFNRNLHQVNDDPVTAAVVQVSDRPQHKLLFDSNRSGSFGIYVMDVASLKISTLFDSEQHDMCPRLSPDGKWIAFIRTNSLVRYHPAELWRIGSNGENLEFITHDAECPSFHPNSKHIRFVRRGRHVVQINPTNKKERILLSSAQICTKSKSGSIHLVQSSRSNSKQFLLAVACKRSWSALMVDLDKHGTDEFVRRAGQGCQPTWFNNNGKNEQVIWITGEKRLDRTGIVSWDPVSGERAVIHDDDIPWGHEYFPAMSRDGESLFYSACGPDGHDHVTSPYQLFVKSLKSGLVTQLTNDGFVNRVAQEFYSAAES